MVSFLRGEYHQKLIAEKRRKMPRTSKARSDLTRKAKYGLELAHHKLKIRKQREEITKLKRSIKALRDEDNTNPGARPVLEVLK
jgi:hypothetical protein